MKKIMFNDKYGLTAAVLNGNKTQTRRFISDKLLSRYGHNKYNDKCYYLICNAPFEVGEEVAVAQNYNEVYSYFRQHNENVRVEKLQDISEVDCIREGVFDLEPYGIRPKYTVNNLGEVFLTEKEAYAALIDRISGNGTWERNPWVFVYNFKLIK